MLASAGKADNITGSVDVRDGGPEVFIHDQLAAAVGHQSDGFQIEQVAVGLPTDRIEQRRALDLLSAFQLGKNAVAFGVEAYGYHFFSETQDRSELPQLKAQALNDLAIAELKHRRALVQQGDFDAQRSKHRRIFQSDDPGADHNQLARQFLQVVYLVGIEDALAVNGDLRIVRGAGPAGNDEVVPRSRVKPSSLATSMLCASRKRALPS